MILKLGVCSDLHIDTHDKPTLLKLLDEFKRVYEIVNYIVIAGDICNNLPKNINMVNYFFSMFADKIIWVPGNHEYWGSSFKLVEQAIKQLNFKYKLDNQLLTLPEGLKLFGGTLWFQNSNIVQQFVGAGVWPDFTLVKDYNKIFAKHEEFKQKVVLDQPDIIISHHLPSYLSVAPAFKNADTNVFFASNLDYLFDRIHPRFFIHGHTHNPFDYITGKYKTRVVCQPLGYPSELSNSYTMKIIEVVS